MNLSLRIARRYLLAKKSTNAINIITGISVFGIAVGSAALILVLSVFNGFEDLITDMYSNFDPDIKVTPLQGKTFTVNDSLIATLKAVDGIAHVGQSLEEIAFFEYDDNQDFGTLKGVDEEFLRVTRIDSTVREGRYALRDGERDMAVLGLGMRNKLGVNVEDVLSPIGVYLPKTEEVGPFEQPFRKRFLYPAGTFVIQQEFNNQYVLSSLQLARELLQAPDKVSALEIGLDAEGANREEQVMANIHEILGPGYAVKNRFQQEETFLRLMQIEKWMSYAIVSLMMLLVAFNMVGALWMIVLEKRKDIAILKSMGALDRTIQRIFLNEGLLLSLLGLFMGFCLALLVYWIQQHYGIVGIPGNFIVEAYPISLRLADFVVVFLTVSGIGLLASLPPSIRARRVPTFIREE